MKLYTTSTSAYLKSVEYILKSAKNDHESHPKQGYNIILFYNRGEVQSRSFAAHDGPLDTKGVWEVYKTV